MWNIYGIGGIFFWWSALNWKRKKYISFMSFSSLSLSLPTLPISLLLLVQPYPTPLLPSRRSRRTQPEASPIQQMNPATGEPNQAPLPSRRIQHMSHPEEPRWKQTQFLSHPDKPTPLSPKWTRASPIQMNPDELTVSVSSLSQHRPRVSLGPIKQWSCMHIRLSSCAKI